MPIGKADYELAFKTSADLEGFEKMMDGYSSLSAHLEKLKGQLAEAKAAGIVIPPDATAKVEELEKALGRFGEKSEEGFKIFGRGAHEAHAALDALGEAFPGVGEMARFLMNPITAVIGGAIFLFGKFKEAIDDANKALDDLANSPGARAGWIDDERDAAEKAAVSFAVWEANMRSMIDVSGQLRQSMADLVASQNLQIQTANQIAAAQRAVEEAKVDLALKLGQITPEQAIKIKLQLDEAAFKEQAEIRIKEIEAEINARTHEASQAFDNTRGAAEKVNQTDSAARAAEQAKIRNQGKLDQDKETLKQSQEQLEKAQKTIEELEGKGLWGGKYDKSDPQYYTLQAARNTVESELSRQSHLRHAIDQEQSKQPGLDTAAQTSAKAAEDARKQYEDSQKEMLEARKQVAKLQSDLEAEKAKTSALESLHNQAAEIHAQGQEVDAFRHLSEAVQSGRATPEQEREWNQTTQPPGAQTGAPGVAAPGVAAPGGVDIDAARRALTNLQMRHYTGNNPSDSQMVDLLNEFIALGHDLRATSAQRGELDQLRQVVQSLRQEVQNQESRMSSGQYIH